MSMTKTALDRQRKRGQKTSLELTQRSNGFQKNLFSSLANGWH